MSKQLNVLKKKGKTDISFHFDVLNSYEDFVNGSCEEAYIVFFMTKKKTEKKKLSLFELKSELNVNKNVKMIMILVQNSQRDYIYDVLNEISSKKGICSPLIESENAILYFPELRYSDLGLLAFLCEKKINITDYRLAMTSGRLLGGRYV